MSYIPRFILGRQSGLLDIPAASGVSASVDLTVLNSAYVRLRNLGDVPVGQGGSDSDYGYLTLSILTATTVRVTLTRTTSGSSGTHTRWEVTDLSPFFVKSIQRGTGSTVITAVDLNHCALDYLGARYTADVGPDQKPGYVMLTDATHVTQVDATSGIISWQLIEGR